MKISTQYVAGLFDGEGSISVAVVRGGPRSSPHHRLAVTLTIAHRAVLDEIATRWGGSVFEKGPRKNGGTMICEWKIQGPPAAAFLREIRRHMVVKRPQADLALAFQSRLVDQRGGHSRTSPGEMIAREEIREALWRLNGSRPGYRPVLIDE